MALFSRLFKSKHRPASKKPTRRLCKIESLEDRKLMAVTASLANGVLDIRGTAGDDTVIVRQIGNTVSIDNVRIQGTSGPVNLVRVQGFGGNDTLRMDGNGVAGQAVKVAGLIFGGAGNDFIVGGDRRDELQGGEGHDTLYGMGDNDVLFGHAGNDLMFGGAGNDDLVGGSGHDEMLGETGNDKLWGESGNDWLFGGAGNDFLDGGSELDVAYGGSGADSFKNCNDAGFFIVHPHIRSPRRGVGDLMSHGIQDFNSSEGDRRV